MEGSPVELSQLPDDILGAIFEVAGLGQGHLLTPVCRRWRCVFFAQPAFWRSFTVSSCAEGFSAKVKCGKDWVSLTRDELWGWAAVKESVLRRVAGFVEVCAVHASAESAADDGGVPGLALAGALVLLRPAALRELRCSFYSSPMPPAALQALRRLTALTHLSLESRVFQLPVAVPDALAGPLAHSLQSLSLTTATVPDALLHSVSQLARLTQLAVTSTSPPSSAFGGWRRLTALARLRQLHLQANSSQAEMLVPAPAEFPALETFHFQGSTSIQLPGARLRATTYSHPSAGGDSELRVWGAGLDGPSHSGVRPLLEALLGPRRPLRLRLDSFELPPITGCTQLAQLTELKLTSCYPNEGSIDAALQALVLAAPQLAQLSVTAYMEEAPQFLVSCTRLTRLELYGPIPELPGGQYLEGLKFLSLHGTTFTQLPPALAAASSLRHLEFGRIGNVGFDTAGLEDILAGMPQLRTLKIEISQLDSLPHGQYMSGIEELSLQNSGLEQLPAPLLHASALTGLDLSGNPGLALAAAMPVDGILPRLRRLDLSGCELEELSGGDYLSGLEELVLAHNKFSRIPPELGAHCGFGGAPALTSLDLSGNPLCLSSADMQDLPLNLRRLDLSGCDLNSLPPGSYLFGLEELVLRSNAFTRLPPALAAATSLVRLDLSENYRLSLTGGEAEGMLLSHMPRLRSLGLVQARIQPCVQDLRLLMRRVAPQLQLTMHSGAL